VDDEADLRLLLKSILESEYTVTEAENGAALKKLLTAEAPDIVLLDLNLPDANGLDLLPQLKKSWPDAEVVVLTGAATFEAAVEATKRGAYHFINKPFDTSALLVTIERAIENQQQKEENNSLRRALSAMSGSSAPVFQSPQMQNVVRTLERIAPSDVTILITGESGTGKEVIADLIHSLSPRSKNKIVKVNCAALPREFIESELFGHEKGAFTGSLSRHQGRFEIANGGTFFLDEIGELPLELQGKLLRVLQDGEFERLGGTQTIKVDTRIIAATNRNLEEEVHQGRFREDLWYRLNVFPITSPPLRDRADDIPLLVNFYVTKIAKRMGKTIDIIPVTAMDALQQYHWPGNIRELENVLERAVINSSGPKLRLVDELKKSVHDSFTPSRTLAAVERDYILQVLELTNWKVSGKNSAAEILGLDRSTLRARMSKLNIEKT